MREAYFFESMNNVYMTLNELAIEYITGYYDDNSFNEYIGTCVLLGTIREVSKEEFLKHRELIT